VAASVEDRLIKLEEDLNRLMQRLMDAAITEDAEEYRLLHESRIDDLGDRAKRLEELVSALQTKHIIAAREKVSE
jgi:hypothetical protein